MEVAMVPIMSLWLPILLSAVFVFIVSFVIHTVLQYHNSDFKKVPDEEKALEWFRSVAIPPGEYLMPRAESMKQMNSPEFREKLAKYPGVMFTIWHSGRPSMGKSLALWFLYSVVIGIFAAYVAGRALGPGAPYRSVFRFVGVTAFACYAVAEWHEWIWFKRSTGRVIKNTLDGLVYALVTAGTFGWLWPTEMM
jgi:Flp pilus assembly protein TadB